VRPTDKKSSVETARPDARHRCSRAGAIRAMSSRAARRYDRTHGETARPDARHRRISAGAIRTTSSRAARLSDRAHGETTRPTDEKSSGTTAYDKVEVESVQPGDK
jgi:hypothetical protein